MVINTSIDDQPNLAHAIPAAYPETPPGKWQKCGGPPQLDPYYNVPAVSPEPIIQQISLHETIGTAFPNAAPGNSLKSETAPWRKSVGGTGLPAAKPRLDKGIFEQPWNKLNGKCGLYPQVPPPTIPKYGTILILFSGPSSNPANLQHALRKLNLKVEAYDLVDGSDLADDAIWNPIKLKLETVFMLRFSHHLHATPSAGYGDPTPPVHKG